MHPSRAIQGNRSDRLAGKRLALAVTGSIAAVETVKLARELIRHGAEVVPFMSTAATEILHPNALEWATGNDPITRLTGQVEHLMAADGRLDGVVLAPATANTLAKAALAIDDTPVTSLVSTSLGQVPVIIAPAMHEQMIDNPTTSQHLDELEARGAEIVMPTVEEDEAKLAPFEVIVEHVIRELGPRSLAGKRVLVVNGSTIEPMDQMRVVTNKSTGRTGAALAREAFRLGADVTLWLGHHHAGTPEHLPTRRFVTVQDLIDMSPQAAGFDWVLVPAAISDFRSKVADGKISSKGEHSLDLVPTEKVLPRLREALGSVEDGALIAFKAEADITEDQLLEKAGRFRKENQAQAVVANRLEQVDVDQTTLHLVVENGTHTFSGDKETVARELLAAMAQAL